VKTGEQIRKRYLQNCFHLAAFFLSSLGDLGALAVITMQQKNGFAQLERSRLVYLRV
jgi:hypothetical protein